MKKFQFSLETVLDYKQQVLTSLQTEHGAILARLRQQEELLRQLEDQYRQADEEFTQRKMEGISVGDALGFEQYLRAMEQKIHAETLHLEQITREEEAKRQEVVSARQDTASIEKLKEKKLETYRKEVQKSEETALEDFVSTTRILASQA